MAVARQLILQEVQNTPAAAQAWSEAVTQAQEAQCRHDEAYRAWQRSIHVRLARDLGEGSLSPISGTARGPPARRPCGLLDPIEVAPPPVTLSHTTATAMTGAHRVDAADGGGNDEEAPLLRSSSASATPAVTQLATSQACLDGVFFEALLSQELSLSLWRSCGAPQETLECALRDVQRLDEAACHEDAVLHHLHATRFAEQRTYKRRRTELQSQLRKTREKVSALEKLLDVGTAGAAVPRAGRGERLRACLAE